MRIPWLYQVAWRNWSSLEEDKFLEECKELYSESQSVEETDDIFEQEGNREKLWRAVYHLLQQGLQGTLHNGQITNVLLDLMGHNLHVASVIGDVFSTVDIETAHRHKQSVRKCFISLLQNFSSMLHNLLKERVDLLSHTCLLKDIGIIFNTRLFNLQLDKLAKKLYFRQRFNLFREESEGYAKLLTQLNQDVTKLDPQDMSTIAMSLIGQFSLDPNRVYDCILDAFEIQIIPSFFIPLLKQLSPSPDVICELLAFKLESLKEEDSYSLLKQIAILITHEIVGLDAVYSLLSPDDHEIEKEWNGADESFKECCSPSWKVTPTKKFPVSSDSHDDNDIMYYDNQKFCLCEILLDMKAFIYATQLIKKLPELSIVKVPRITLKIIPHVHHLLQHLYKSCLGEESFGENLADSPSFITFEDLRQRIAIILSFGPYAHHDPELIHKLLVIMNAYLKVEKNVEAKERFYYDCLSILGTVILPSISLSCLDGHSNLVQEVWMVLSHYPYDTRFALYGSLKESSMDQGRHPLLVKKRAEVLKSTKAVLNRISNENVLVMGKKLAELAHSMPVAVFDHVLVQIQLFGNLIDCVTESLQYLSCLSYDVLCYCVLTALSSSSSFQGENIGESPKLVKSKSSPNRPRTENNGSTVSQWLQNLCSFGGILCAKYPLDLVPFLQYLANQLKNEQSSDLLLLQKIVQCMTGVEVVEEVTDDQLNALAGGDQLQQEAGYFSKLRMDPSFAQRLSTAVSTSDLALALCIMMSQQRHCDEFRFKHQAQEKVDGKLFDQCQDTLVQFGTFLSKFCSSEDYFNMMPRLDSLIMNYNVSSNAAFFLLRPKFARIVRNIYDALLEDEEEEVEKGLKTLNTSQRMEKNIAALSSVLELVTDDVKILYPPATFCVISPCFFATFWTLTSYDLVVPHESYSSQVCKHYHVLKELFVKTELSSIQKRQENENGFRLVKKLQEEEQEQEEHVKNVLAKLNEEKKSWFVLKNLTTDNVAADLLQHCVFPRCIFSAVDSIYCIHFINILHSLSTPNFSLVAFYERIVCSLMGTVASLTENESSRYGRLMCSMLEKIIHWEDKTAFDKECPGYPVIFTFGDSGSTVETRDKMEHSTFLSLCFNWHRRITEYLCACLKSKDFTQIRNSVVILKTIAPYFPRIERFAHDLKIAVAKVQARERGKRHDLFTVSTSYGVLLQGKNGSFVSADKFGPVTREVAKDQGKVKLIKVEEGESLEIRKINRLTRFSPVAPDTSQNTQVPVTPAVVASTSSSSHRGKDPTPSKRRRSPSSADNHSHSEKRRKRGKKSKSRSKSKHGSRREGHHRKESSHHSNGSRHRDRDRG